ncbi:MAG TPA: hypothetical protein VIF63_06935, partial [Candidatus Limnocylindrales bacterium]
CGSGGSACSMHVAHGATVKLTAATEPGSTFKRWEGACSGSSTTCSVKMADDRSVEAVFAKVATPPPATPKPTAAPKPTATAKAPTATQHVATAAPTTIPSEAAATGTPAPSAIGATTSPGAPTGTPAGALLSPAASIAPSVVAATDSGVGVIALAIVLAGLLIGVGVGVNAYMRRKRT